MRNSRFSPLIAFLALVIVMALCGSIEPATAVLLLFVGAPVLVVLGIAMSMNVARLDNPTNVATFIAPSGGVVAGGVYLIGGTIVFAHEAADEAASFLGTFRDKILRGVEKTTSQAWAVGQALHYDPATGKFTTAVSATTVPAGRVITAALSAATTGDMQLIDQVAIVDDDNS